MARLNSARPTRPELEAAREKTVPDVIAPGLKVLFCGINPGLYTAAVGQHFGRPGNRFWRALHDSGFTPRLYHPSEQWELLALGLGITNVVARATATADELAHEELVEGGRVLARTALEYQPQWLAVLGIGVYRTAFAHPRTKMGEQPDRIGDSRVWVLPNPSGLNAHFQPADLARVFGNLRERTQQ
jgi:TDG/mug DNA glycosylase family protein